MSERLLEGRVAVVTGAGRGIGRAHALRLSAYGAKVVVNDLGVSIEGKATSETPAEEVVAEIRSAGGEAVADASDISKMSGAQAIVRSAIDAWGRLDIVVNNAGIGRPRMVFNLEEDDWDDVIRVHLKGTFAVTREACRFWRSEGKAGRAVYGRIINTSTGLLTLGGAGQSNYVAAKAGIAALTAAVAQEMEPYLVTANAIMPGARTRMASVGWRMDRMEEGGESRDPAHVAELVCYLASPHAGWISGQFFHVSGHRIGHTIPWTDRAELRRADRGWTASDLVREFPRFFGAGPRPNELPPKEWVEKRPSKPRA
jgi:NAD(P)-dependent dehydrogenase (short-subunit alcohol dehydrogenase family)